MNYHQYYPIDVVNGPGTRCTLFVSGCVHQCKGCYNQSTWSLSSGHPYTQELEDRIIADLNDTRIKRRGLSLSGGDPLHPANLEAVLKLVRRVKEECPTKDIWLWTGYQLHELNEQQKQLLPYLDVLVDGKFEQALADPMLEWRGSANQIIHHFKL
ncbi:anaerobic ribonucleoside-triphosphate reductase-activating protein [Vibrio mimicus]|uniref:anaerobic ribonucleoside-triphosphate reductase-activating protein n=1 Tax=Vibrio mimicus TaxID=674 RepID=UPI0002B9A70C|nr:anaerobic ribonucleoside-triphosphate reductase-activating protein [Vibrio mimicus]EMB50015.1 anaerobic ribonucleotide reductase-activating protein [Vibrio mimicus CAIM 602]MBY7676057.1 anaerobic ribonucleoside-triphosphate reductase-activating protein [Vibrio mimicus]MBY7727969.1 anaerobic ribonucleoside-triphosphate reductase-activating protein [Vibrio mimicus]TXY27063.1 anaerobic ribonucleoside-triphosphate reductase-activating protein [Vibrio mimicus]SUQ23665.1 anaerobic ribonucleotide 